MFNECPLFKPIPDISKWNTLNVTKIANMFYGCGIESLVETIVNQTINRYNLNLNQKEVLLNLLNYIN